MIVKRASLLTDLVLASQIFSLPSNCRCRAYGRCSSIKKVFFFARFSYWGNWLTCSGGKGYSPKNSTRDRNRFSSQEFRCLGARNKFRTAAFCRIFNYWTGDRITVYQFVKDKENTIVPPRKQANTTKELLNIPGK